MIPATTTRPESDGHRSVGAPVSALSGVLGAVVIGRNEGQRLQRCLESLTARADHIVYVDSGSTDGSVELARSMGIDVVALSASTPFTAARARNAGAEHILSSWPDLQFLQFVDGDCEVHPEWLSRGLAALFARPEVAIVCGRRRERFRRATRYTRLADMEWDTPVGDTLYCGGDALMRVAAFTTVGGFNPTLIAGEEPELCVRLRRRGWSVLRIDADMTTHEIEMTKFRQWWLRTARGGYAYAEGAWRLGRTPEHHFVREVSSILIGVGGPPLLAIVLAGPARELALLVLLVYPLWWLRIRKNARRRGWSAADCSLYASFTLLGKLAQLVGVMTFLWGQARRRPAVLIEYKQAAAPP